MQKKVTRYLFIGNVDSALFELLSGRGEIVRVTSVEEALKQKGDFTMILLEGNSFSSNIPKELFGHYPETPIIVSNGERPEEPPPYVRFVPFHKILSGEIEREERLARVEIKVEKLREVHRSSKKMLILLHDHPDPDSIASALALRTLLRRNRQTATIGHFGESVSRPENVAMIELLEIVLEELTPSDLDEFDSIALVDVQPNFFENLNRKVNSVIDHHPQVANYESAFKEVHAHEGSTSTILTEFLRAAQVDISERLATALLYGIKTDTFSLNRDANPDDIEAFTFLYPRANTGLLRRIERAEVPTGEIKSFGKALADHWIEQNIFFSYLGKVKREYLIPKMADFGIQVKGVEWSAAFGIVNSYLVISVRNVGYVKSAGRIMREIFGELGSAGGHRSAAKAVIPLKNIKNVIGEKVSKKSLGDWITKLLVQGTSEKASEE